MTTIVAFSITPHNASVCVMSDGKVTLFYQAERIIRIKNCNFIAASNFDPVAEVVNEIDDLVILVKDSNTSSYKQQITTYFLQKNINVKNVVCNMEHHLFHAYSAYYFSGLDNAVCLVLDGAGKHSNVSMSDPLRKITAGILHLKETSSIIEFKIDDNKVTSKNLFKQFFVLNSVKYITHMSNSKVIKEPHNISSYGELLKSLNCNELDLKLTFDSGAIYSNMTIYLGFDLLEEGKVMGLCSYGSCSKKYKILEDYDNLRNVDSIFLFDSNFNKNYDLYYSTFNEKADLAYSLQVGFEKDIDQKIQKIKMLSDCKNIIFSGGCALNVINNSKLIKNFPEFNFFIDPIASDASLSVGAAYYYSLKRKIQNKNNEMVDTIYWGPEYSSEQIKQTIKTKLDDINENCTNH